MNEQPIKSINRLATILQLPKEYLINLSKRSSKCYRPYHQPKKNGKKRLIDNPNEELKVVQARINNRILRSAVDNLPSYMHGARSNKSAITNAKTHLGREAVLSLDLENCFPNITRDMVYKVFRDDLRCIPEVAKVLTRLTARNHGLPQGSPSSSSICNLVLASICRDINAICEKANCSYSQYIDDMFISGKPENIKSLLPFAKEIFKHSKHKLNKNKIRIMTRSHPMNITGAILNTGELTAGRQKIRQIEHEIFIFNNYNEHKCIYKNGERRKRYTRDVLNGKINNVYAINPRQGRRLREKFNKKLRQLRNVRT